MLARYARAGLVALVLLPAVTWAATSSDLATAYAAILKGDYTAGRNIVEQALGAEAPAEAQRIRGWLAAYERVASKRSELKAATYQWNLEQAQQALAAGRVTLALSFAAQAVPYAEDMAAMAAHPTIQELTKAARAAAAEAFAEQQRTRALSFYMLLSRLHPEDAEIKDRRDEIGRFVRIEAVYEDRKALDARLKDVRADQLRRAIEMIDRLYYRTPDFRDLARSALRNLRTVSEVDKLATYLDGLANVQLRNSFQGELARLAARVEEASKFTHQDLWALYNDVQKLNRGTIELPDQLVVVEFLNGVVGALDDYTSVIWPADAEDFGKYMGEFQGVGIQLGIEELTGRLKVVTPLEGSPALEAGLQPDDLIIAVDGKDTRNWTTDDAVENIMGPAGTEVALTVHRPRTDDVLRFNLVRRRILLTTVRGIERSPGDATAWNYILDPDSGIAYIRLTQFLQESAGELTRALRAAQEQGMRGLVLDLRYNPGGLLDVAIDVVDNFLAEGDVVVTRGRLSADDRKRASGSAPYRELPIVVLVNEHSASASEILAGALQDHHRALVLGDRTFGKGSVQHLRPLTSRAAPSLTDARLKLTTALYYLPSGRTPHKAEGEAEWGVRPDYERKLTPKEQRRVLERERLAFIIHNEADLGKGERLSSEERAALLTSEKDSEEQAADRPFLTEDDLKLLEADPFEAPDVDPQLEEALLLIRVKLAGDLPWPQQLASARQEKK
ncbi:MAG: S41 family peptidase [Phycisphaerales bacterium]|nr:S41 family peptidase [Phycisphaerales bacterium]